MQLDESMAQLQERITALEQENTMLCTELQVCQCSLLSQAGVAELERANALLQAEVAEHRRREQVWQGQLQALTKQAAIAKEQEKAAQERAAELAKANEALKRSLSRLTNEPDLDLFLGHVLLEVTQQVGAFGRSHIFLFDAATNTLKATVAVRDSQIQFGAFEDDPEIFHAPIAADITPAFKFLCQTREILMLNTNEYDGMAWPGTIEWHRSHGHREAAALALIAGDQPVGMLGLAFLNKSALKPEELELIHALANQAALAIQLTRLTEQAKEAAVLEEQEKAATERAAELAKANVALQMQMAVRKQMEMALRESERRFRGIFEQAAVGIALTSLSGQWLQINQRLCDIVGYSPEELLALTFQDITQPEDLPADLDSIPRLIQGEICTRQVEKQYIRKDGSLVWVDLTVSVARNDTGAASYFICIIQDISQRKAAELVSLGQQMALKGTLNFLATEPELDKFLGHVLTTVSEQLAALVADIWLDDAEAGLAWLHLTSWQGQILTAAEQPNHPGTTPLPTSRFRHYSCWQSLHSRHQPYVYHDFLNHPEMSAFREWAVDDYEPTWTRDSNCGVCPARTRLNFQTRYR